MATGDTERIVNEIKEQIAIREKQIERILEVSKQIEEIELKPTLYGMQLDFDNLAHEDVIKVIQLFPGSWKKDYNEDSINYTNVLVSGLVIRCYSGKPPPNCKIVDAGEEYVPGYVRRKFKVVCEGTEAANETNP